MINDFALCSNLISPAGCHVSWKQPIVLANTNVPFEILKCYVESNYYQNLLAEDKRLLDIFLTGFHEAPVKMNIYVELSLPMKLILKFKINVKSWERCT